MDNYTVDVMPKEDFQDFQALLQYDNDKDLKTYFCMTRLKDLFPVLAATICCEFKSHWCHDTTLLMSVLHTSSCHMQSKTFLPQVVYMYKIGTFQY